VPGDAGPPAIKGIRIDQGQMHAEKRSNHVHLPLIGGETRAAGGGRRWRCARRVRRVLGTVSSVRPDRI
jgi:hypothetical protein